MTDIQLVILGMAIRRILGTDSVSYKNPFKKKIFLGLWILGIIEDFRIADFSNIFEGLFMNKNYVLNYTFFRIFTVAFLLFLAPTAIIF